MNSVNLKANNLRRTHKKCFCRLSSLFYTLARVLWYCHHLWLYSYTRTIFIVLASHVRPSTFDVLTSLDSVNLSSYAVRRFFWERASEHRQVLLCFFQHLSNLILRGFFYVARFFNVKCVCFLQAWWLRIISGCPEVSWCHAKEAERQRERERETKRERERECEYFLA